MYYAIGRVIPKQPELLNSIAGLVYAVATAVVVFIILRTTKVSVPSVMKGQSGVKQVFYWACGIILIAFTFLAVDVIENALSVFDLLDTSISAFWTMTFTACKAGIFEEFLTRGLLFDIFHAFTARSRFTLLWSSLGNSAIFASMHLMNIITVGQSVESTLQQVLYTFAMGLTFSFLRVLSNGLSLGAVVHAIVDFQVTITGPTRSGDWRAIVVMSAAWFIPAVLLLAFMPARKHVNETAKLAKE
ncbi:CPBP family intramembrane glutamic endopeptidase [Bifidobacterium sp. ESL0745]|uniref:CPBP family intramembrane glutamic endopeptidase n=1 Tax=Bifidobacterium sp. ESL0745 TaxID=2983226 RepID=UPI0023F8F3D9|nr:CPBP family intramembrane glutamic endopeptidase [Bifidobacterium sp. ESL0745]MDF7665926.1 CPBP family intramembrane metalloprotease [Bifidobacterium sp. ESL0745]